MHNDSTGTSETQHTSNEHATQGHAVEHSAQHQAHAEHVNPNDLPKEQIFDHLLSELGDHHELSMAFVNAEVLPIIVYDENGIHAWRNPHVMEEEGTYTMFHTESKDLAAFNGQPVRAKKGAVILINGKPIKASFDFSVTNLVAYEWLGMFIMVVLFFIAGRKYKKNPGSAPKGIQNALEMLVVYLRDEVIRPNVGTKRVTNQLLPYFLTIFFFIMVLNYIGLLPGMHAATGAIGFTSALALTSFFVVNIVALKEAGVGAWFHHLLGGAPWYMAIIMVPIEVIGLFTKPFALTVRLFANMTAGHVVFLSLLGLIFFFTKLYGPAGGFGVSVISVGFSVFVYFIETLVCFLQAYIFTMLTAVFVGLAIGDHKHEDPHAAHH